MKVRTAKSLAVLILLTVVALTRGAQVSPAANASVSNASTTSTNNMHQSALTQPTTTSLGSAASAGDSNKPESKSGNAGSSADPPLSASSTRVNCVPSSVGFGSSTLCTATVSGASEPTGSVYWSTSEQGSFSNTMYGCDYSDTGSSLYTIDSTTGETTLIGPMYVYGCLGLTFNNDGELFAYGYTAEEALGIFSVDLSTGAATLIADVSSPSSSCPNWEILGFASNPSSGKLYATFSNCLVIIDPKTGAVTEIGTADYGTYYGNALAFGPSNILYSAGGYPSLTLYTLDPTTASATHGVVLAGSPSSGCSMETLTFNEGELYGVLYCSGNSEYYFVSISTNTGAMTVIGQPSEGLVAIAAGPYCNLSSGTCSATYTPTPPTLVYGCATPEDTSFLYAIDPATGGATLIGSMGMKGCSGLVFSASGTLYAFGLDENWDSSLFIVNVTTGAATPSGESGLSGCEEPYGLALSPTDGTLYAALDNCIVKLASSNGAATLIGSTDFSATDEYGSALAFSSSNKLYAASDGLYTVNPETAADSRVAQFSGYPSGCDESDSEVSGLSFNGNTLYGVLECAVGTFLVTVNTSTAAMTVVGQTLDTLYAIAWLPNCALSTSSCSTIPTPPLTTITAYYEGDSNHATSSGTFILNNGAHTTTTTTTTSSSTGTVAPGTSVTDSAIVAAVSGPTVPTGTVQFYFCGPTGTATSCATAPGNAVGLPVTLVSGSATSGAESPSAVGYYCWSAVYTPDTSGFTGSSSTTTTNECFQVVVPRTTTTSLSCLPALIAPGSLTTCKATVSGSSPSGTVTFSSSTSTGTFTPVSGECTLSSGSCSVSYTDTAIGTAGITAAYGGDSNNLRSSGTFLLTINSLSVTCLDSSLPLSYYGTYTICTATVTGSSPSGEVLWSSSAGGSFSEPPSTTSAPECTLSSGSCSVPFLPSLVSYEFSPVTITASYVGDANNAPSSDTFSITITWVPGCMGSIVYEVQDSSGLCLQDPPANTLITTPGGGQIGCDASGNIVNTIGASAFVSGCSPLEETVGIANFATGLYQVQIFGTGAGTVTATIETFDSSGKLLYTATYDVSVTQGSSQTILLNVAADGQITTSVSPPGVPQFPLSSGLAVAAIGMLALAAFMRVRAPRKSVPA